MEFVNGLLYTQKWGGYTLKSINKTLKIDFDSHTLTISKGLYIHYFAWKYMGIKFAHNETKIFSCQWNSGMWAKLKKLIACNRKNSTHDAKTKGL